MLRFGSVLLAGLLVLSGCGSDKSALADSELLKACDLQAKYWNQIGVPDPNFEDTDEYLRNYEKKVEMTETQMETYLTKAAKLNSDYEKYLGEWLENGWGPSDKLDVKCAVLK